MGIFLALVEVCDCQLSYALSVFLSIIIILRVLYSCEHGMVDLLLYSDLIGFLLYCFIDCVAPEKITCVTSSISLYATVTIVGDFDTVIVVA